MVRLTVSDEDARLITEASTPVIIVDQSGRRLGQLVPVDAKIASQASISDEEFAKVKRRMASPGPGFTTAEVLAHLQTLGQ